MLCRGREADVALRPIRPREGDARASSSQDLSHPNRAGEHQRQELAANTFAIEVLAYDRV